MAASKTNSYGNINMKTAVYPDGQNPLCLNTLCACTVSCSAEAAVSRGRLIYSSAKTDCCQICSPDSRNNPSRKCLLLFIIIVFPQCQSQRGSGMVSNSTVTNLSVTFDSYLRGTSTETLLEQLRHISQVHSYLTQSAADIDSVTHAFTQSRCD